MTKHLNTGVKVTYNDKGEIKSVSSPYHPDEKKDCKTIAVVKSTINYFKSLRK